MALYAVGDVQGCLRSFDRLLETIRFNTARDHLVLVGDLVNRGPDSEGVLKRVMALGDSVSCVLGNHDLNTLAVAEGLRPDKPRDTIRSLLESPCVGEMLEWLRRLPLMCEIDGIVFCHAGIYPGWDLREAAERAREFEDVLRGRKYRDFLGNMFGSEPAAWHPDLEGWDRLRFITNAFTRMRFVNDRGELDFLDTGPPGTQRKGLTPWFEWPGRRDARHQVVFGHWSSLGYNAARGALCLDSGCVWGQSLTAVRFEGSSLTAHHVRCKETA
ncbi:MAG: symmetrical bis(5'-nucleosyl)-tetraphosphatase [Proteobacteria bacterium]|nr:MAG: symmetrical bis(5'-nucleosyl)-tetraphosphatase [Pseudomonadota bacterium]